MGMFDNQFFHRIWQAGVEKITSPAALEFFGATVTANPITGRTEILIGGGDADWDGSRTWHVGGAAWMYPTIQAALDAIVADPTPPSQTQQAVVLIHPGTYTMTARIDVPQWVTIKGSCRTAVHLRNDTTDMFKCTGDGVVFETFTIDGSTSNGAIYGIDCNNRSGVYVHQVDMFSVPAGQAKQRFLTQSGSTWKVLHIEGCAIDYRGLNEYAIKLVNTGAVRFCDTWIERNFIDAFALTGFGGVAYVEKAQDVRFWSNVFRGTSSFYTGVFVSRGGSGVNINVEFSHHTGTGALAAGHAGGVAAFGESNCTLTFDNSIARGAAVAAGGTLTTRNTTITA